MPTVDDLKESKYLTKADVTPPVLVTIQGYTQEDVSLESEPPRMKYTLSFHELDKPLVLNVTNGKRIAKVTGTDDLDGWVGKEIVLFFDENVEYAGEMVGGIRVQIPQPEIQQPVRPGETYVGDEPPPATDAEAAKNADMGECPI